jgi:ketosteroid isomerase-like protein
LDYLTDLEATWADHRVTTEEFIPAGENKLVVALPVKGVGRESGVPFNQRTYGVLEFRHSKALRARWYSGREEALEAVGLSE